MNVGGEVPGMAKQAPAGITGQSSNIDVGVYATRPNKMSEEEFVQGFLSIMPSNIVGDAVRQLGLGENVGKQMYQQYKDTEEMAEGGEVQSDETLQSNAFVIPADVVGHIGDGSSDAGAQRLQSYLGMTRSNTKRVGLWRVNYKDQVVGWMILSRRALRVNEPQLSVPKNL